MSPVPPHGPSPASFPEREDVLEESQGAESHISHLTLLRPKSPDTDAILVERVGRREPHALENLYRETPHRLFAIALRMLGNAEDAREALQDTYLRIWDKAAHYDAGRSRAFSWMVMLLRGICLDKMRKHRLRAPVWVDWNEVREWSGQRGFDALASPGDDFLTAQTLEEVERAYRSLPASEQQWIHAALFRPGTVEEFAVTMAQPVGTVKSKIHRAMAKLRALLQHEQNYES